MLNGGISSANEDGLGAPLRCRRAGGLSSSAGLFSSLAGLFSSAILGMFFCW